MKTIELTCLALTDLNLTYARNMGGNKIKHYKTTWSPLLGQNDVRRSLKKFIENEENEDVELVFVPQNAHHLTRGETLVIKDASEAIFSDNKNNKIKKTLSKKKYGNLINTSLHLSMVKRVVNSIINALNGCTRLVNKIFQKIGIPSMSLIPKFEHKVRVSIAKYLTVAFEEGQEEESAIALLDDLKMLVNNGLVVGSICPPSIIKLANTLGNGKSWFVLFCFPVINEEKLVKSIKSHSGKLSTELINIGVKYETQEGGIKWLNNKNPSSNYEIEEVKVNLLDEDEARNKYIESYLSAIDTNGKRKDKNKKSLESKKDGK